MLKEVRTFILRGNAIDLAVAVVIGAAFGAVVTSLVADIITPIKPVNMLMERRKRGEEPPPEAVPEDIVLLGEIRDLLQAARTPSRPT